MENDILLFIFIDTLRYMTFRTNRKQQNRYCTGCESNHFSPTKIDSTDLKDSYSVSKGGAMSTALTTFSFPRCLATFV